MNPFATWLVGYFALIFAIVSTLCAIWFGRVSLKPGERTKLESQTPYAKAAYYFGGIIVGVSILASFGFVVYQLGAFIQGTF